MLQPNKDKSIKAVTPANKVNRNGKNYDKTYLPEMEPFQMRPCVGDGCGKQVMKDSSQLLGRYDDSSSFDPKVFGTGNSSRYGQWNIPTTYANKKGADGKPLTRKLDLTEEQMKNPKIQRDSISQGDKIYFRKPGVWSPYAAGSNKLYGRDKTDQEIRHVAMAMGKNEKGEVLFQHSMGAHNLNRETMAQLQERGYSPKVGYRTKTTQEQLQDSPEKGYSKKTTLKTNSDSDFVNQTSRAIYTSKSEIGTRYGLSRSLMDKLSSNVIPIGVQESNAGFEKSAKGFAVKKAGALSNWVDEVYDSKISNKAIKPLAKIAKNAMSNVGSFFNMIKDGDIDKAFSASDRKKSPWEMELKANEMSKNNPEKYKENYRKLKYDNDNSYVDISPGESSRGFGKIKNIPAVAKEFGVTKENLEGSKERDRSKKIRNNAIASTSVLAENARRIKDKYPDLNENQVSDLATTAYNSGLDSVMKDEYVNKYIRNKTMGVDGKVLTSSYLEKIKALKKPVTNYKSK